MRAYAGTMRRRMTGTLVGADNAAKVNRQARRHAEESLAFGMDRPPETIEEDQAQTRRDIRAALIFGVLAATLELAAILWFFR